MNRLVVLLNICYIYIVCWIIYSTTDNGLFLINFYKNLKNNVVLIKKKKNRFFSFNLMHPR